MTTPTGNSQQPELSKSTPSSRAISLVAIAVLVGILLLVIVDSDNLSKKNASNATPTTVATTPSNNDTGETVNTVTTSTTTPISGTKKPAEVSVLILNGSSGSGIASAVSTAVGELGYKMLTPGNDSSTAKGTIVYYKAGFEKDAKQLATNILPGVLTDIDIPQEVTMEQFPASAPTEWDQDNLISANVVVVVGNS